MWRKTSYHPQAIGEYPPWKATKTTLCPWERDRKHFEPRSCRDHGAVGEEHIHRKGPSPRPRHTATSDPGWTRARESLLPPVPHFPAGSNDYNSYQLLPCEAGRRADLPGTFSRHTFSRKKTWRWGGSRKTFWWTMTCFMPRQSVLFEAFAALRVAMTDQTPPTNKLSYTPK